MSSNKPFKYVILGLDDYSRRLTNYEFISISDADKYAQDSLGLQDYSIVDYPTYVLMNTPDSELESILNFKDYKGELSNGYKHK
jgi:hypothetical protein